VGSKHLYCCKIPAGLLRIHPNPTESVRIRKPQPSNSALPFGPLIAVASIIFVGAYVLFGSDFIHGRGLYSSTSQLIVSTFCGLRTSTSHFVVCVYCELSRALRDTEWLRLSWELDLAPASMTKTGFG
jgi:hypothetical protein